MKRIHSYLATLGLAAILANSSFAGSITIDGTGRNVYSVTNTPSSDSNFIAGNCSVLDCGTYAGGEYRNMFLFSIPVLSGPVTSATLHIYTGGISLMQYLLLYYQISAEPANDVTFADLGTGTPYGSTTLLASNAYSFIDITLDSAAFADIQAAEGGAQNSFEIGGLVPITTLTPVQFGGSYPDQGAFLFTHGGDVTSPNGYSGQVQLELTTQDPPPPAPEPVSFLLTGAGVAGLLMRRRLIC